MATVLLSSGVALAEVLSVAGGPDAIEGAVEGDSATGLGGGDVLAGDPSLFGSGGDDQVYGRGGDGDDLVDDGPPFDASSDLISGGAGDDVMDAFNAPAFADVVDCGPGEDVVYTDGSDLISDDYEEIVLGPHPDAWDANPYQPVQLGS